MGQLLDFLFPDDEEKIKHGLKVVRNSTDGLKEKKVDLSHSIVFWFLVAIVVVIVLFDVTMLVVFGARGTITGFVRENQNSSVWPEFVFLVWAVLTYLHFFRGWL